jgi:hypothetical protein
MTEEANRIAATLDREMIELMKIGGVPKTEIARLFSDYYIHLNTINSRQGLPTYAQTIRRSFRSWLNIISNPIDEEMGYILLDEDGRIIMSSRVRLDENIKAFWKVRSPRLAVTRVIPEKMGVDDITVALSPFMIA